LNQNDVIAVKKTIEVEEDEISTDGEKRKACGILVGKPEGKRQIG
jgi:hypothetical protein